jgi:serine/threonine protein kinase
VLTTSVDVDSFSSFRHEVSLMAKLKHNNLVALRGISMRDPPAIALEYVEFGDLLTLLEHQHDLSNNLKIRFAFDIGMFQSVF